jgi:YesN/AraC family two-component response regulator
MMPYMDGFELTEKLKRDELTSHIPIILLTARSSEENVIAGLETGADDYIGKPFNMEVLKAKVKSVIDNRKLIREKFLKETTQSIPSEGLNKADKRFFEKAVHIVEKHLCDNAFDTPDFGRELGMSRSHLYRKLKSLTGQAPNEFIRTIRLKHGAKLLVDEGLTVSEVSYRVGFTNYTYFSKCFSDHFGMSPSEYINRTK